MQGSGQQLVQFSRQVGKSVALHMRTYCPVSCRYEVHHGVRISDSALVEAAILSDRYIADRFLPDKAIDLIDESAAKLKMEITSKPLHLDEIDRKVGQAAVQVCSTYIQHLHKECSATG